MIRVRRNTPPGHPHGDFVRIVVVRNQSITDGSPENCMHEI